MSRVVQQDLEEMSRNTHLEHERQGQLLALGRAGVPHYIADAIPAPDEPPRQWGVGKALGAIAGGFRSVFGASDDDQSTAYVSGTGAASSSAPPIGVDHSAEHRERLDVMERATRVLQEREAERQKREAIEQEALENAMDVDTPVVQTQHVQNILLYFQSRFDLRAQTEMNFTSYDFSNYLVQNINQVNQQYNEGVDPRSIMYQAMQDAQRGHQHGLAAHEGQLYITPPGPSRTPAAGPKAKAKGQPKRRGRALMNTPAPVPAALAVAAAPSGPGTLIPWQKQQAVIAEPSSASAAASTAAPRVASGGATLVRPKLKQLGKTAQAQAKARAKAHAKAKAGPSRPRPSVWASSEEDEYGGWEGRVG